MTRTALIAGASGQDGAYLARLLLGKGYRVVAGLRQASSRQPMRMIELGVAGDVEYVLLDVRERTGLTRLIETIGPDEIYNFAARSAVAQSFSDEIETLQVNAVGAANLLDAAHKAVPDTRYYQASSSEMFGPLAAGAVAQNEEHRFHPRSPYGVSKLGAHWLTINFRESFGLFALCGILFNHESPLRSPQFVTRKITQGLLDVRHGRRGQIELGNLDARRDWGFAGDYVDGIWRMLQQPVAEEYVLATGRSESVRTLVELVAAQLDMAIEWEGSGGATRGIDRRTGRTVVAVSEALYRPAEIDVCRGDAKKARERLDWSATTTLEETVAMMVEADERRLLDTARVA